MLFYHALFEFIWVVTIVFLIFLELLSIFLIVFSYNLLPTSDIFFLPFTSQPIDFFSCIVQILIYAHNQGQWDFYVIPAFHLPDLCILRNLIQFVFFFLWQVLVVLMFIWYHFRELTVDFPINLIAINCEDLLFLHWH